MRQTAPSAAARVAALAFAALVVCSAVTPAALAAPAPTPTPAAVSTTATAGAANHAAPADPETDVVGWENGYWHNESIDVDQSDGLSDAELERFVARSMARVEYVREREFNATVPVSVISREDYRNRTNERTANRTTFDRWNDQVWEGLFIVGESTGSGSAIAQTTGSSVAGFYSPRDDEIKIITPDPDQPVISNATLIHELVHALQDQRYNLSSETYSAPTQDGDLAVDGVVEGEANYVEARYSERCGDEWTCVSTPQSGGGGSSGPGPNLGILLTLLNPYSDGPVLVHQLVEEGGWDAFEERFVDPPVSTEQVIHLTDEKPRPLNFTDRARGDWETFPRNDSQLGQNGSDTVGEASIYAMFWYQAREYGADTIDPNSLFDTTGEYDTYNYDAEPSNGWANDRLFPYRTGTGEDAEYGYVWLTAWDTREDAREFYDTYLRMLEAHDVRRTDEGYYVVPDGEFADAFLIRLDGRRVTIVNGPTVADVKQIRPGLEPRTQSDSGTPTATESEPITPTETATPGDGDGEDGTTSGGTTETGGAGFGFAIAVVAVGLAGLLARRRE